MARRLDKLAEFEEFNSSILPALKKDLKAGFSAEQIREKYAAIVQAMLVTTALTEEDAGKRNQAAKDTLDRHEGKAKERVEQTHKFENLEEDQVTAILTSKLASLKKLEAEDDDETLRH